jgi:hypothetical protein
MHEARGHACCAAEPPGGACAASGNHLPAAFCEKLLERSDSQAVWLSAAALLTCQLPHVLQWWQVAEVACVACAAAEDALASTAPALPGASGSLMEEHRWLVVSWALLAIEGACNVAWGAPAGDRCRASLRRHLKRAEEVRSAAERSSARCMHAGHR